MGEVMTMPDGTTFEVLRSAEDPERDPSEMVFTAQPNGPAPPPHVHPRQRETFTCEEGHFELLVDGEWRRLPPGESLVIQPGQVHTYRNEGTQTAKVRTVHEPALEFEAYIRDLHATVVEHDIRKITPGAAVRMAVLWRERSDTIQPGPLPLKIAFGLLGRIGPLLGLRPSKAPAAGADQAS
jgi:quercetin dioxygenase-like cupin family protein